MLENPSVSSDMIGISLTYSLGIFSFEKNINRTNDRKYITKNGANDWNSFSKEPIGSFESHYESLVTHNLQFKVSGSSKLGISKHM